MTLLTLPLQSASHPTYSPDLSGGQRPTLVGLTRQSWSHSLSEMLPGCDVFQTIFCVHRDESGRVNQQEVGAVYLTKIFSQVRVRRPNKILENCGS